MCTLDINVLCNSMKYLPSTFFASNNNREWDVKGGFQIGLLIISFFTRDILSEGIYDLLNLMYIWDL